MGAWQTTYHRGLRAEPDSPTGRAIVAVKRELAFNGFAGKMQLYSPVCGIEFDAAAREFQKAFKLTVDGDIGPSSALVLWRERTGVLEGRLRYGIAGHWLGRLKTLESANDPACIGTTDPDDLGLLQINRRANPDVTDELAFDPVWALEWGARRLRGQYDALHDWEAAVAAHNMPALADDWLRAGKPSEGGPWLPVVQMATYTWLSRYVAMVERQPW